MKKTLIILNLFLTIFGANAQIWRQEIDPILNLPPNFYAMTKGYDIQETADGNYVFAGRLESGISVNFISESVLAKLDAATGNILWTKRYPYFPNGTIQEVSLIEKPNGNLLLAGLENNGIFLIETDANGDTVSTKRIISTCETANGIDCGLATIRLRATLDGNYIIGIGASSQIVGFGIPYPINQLIKIAPDNTIIWNKIYGNRFFLDFQPTSDGGYVMSGSDLSLEAIIFKVDMNGDSIWQQSYAGQLMYDLNSIKETSDKGYVVTYNMSGFAGFSPMLMKVDSTGANLLWQVPAIGALGFAQDVQIDMNGNCIVTGSNTVPYGGPLSIMVDAAFVSKIDPNGVALQTQVFDNLFHNSGTVVRPTSDGNFIMAGSRATTLGTQDKGYVVKTGYLLSATEIEKNNASLELFPNPLETSAVLKLNAEYQELNLFVFDALGRQVAMVQEQNASQIILHKNALETGIYFFRVLDGKRVIGSGKFVVK